ncbi:hypothetical protein F1880_009011 [Penicillium rolfsii]|nr:hypothetical protein F1880_009011 [Penicillium rolfsii]
MADHNPPWHNRGTNFILPSTSAANSPLSPAGTGRAPPSFERNVNRQKTQRWVQAKQYSYDGGDWGDDDDDDEEEEEPPAAPVPPYATQKTGSTSDLSSTRLPGLGSGTEAPRAGPTTESKPTSMVGDQKSLPFIRPADIYKRMHEERTPQGEAASSGRPAESQASVQSSPPPTQPIATGGNGTLPGNLGAFPQTTQDAPSITLPEVKRLSGFGAEFLDSTDPSFQQNPSTKTSDASLHHNPSQASQDSLASQGFTSVVHQAFDVPETPKSTAGSVVRSNSDGTSVISPIISHRNTQDDKTPTIPEEPAETSTPTNAPDQAPSFKPGHRRDISLPDGDNSPSKRPVITDNEVPLAGQAEMSSVSLGQSGSPERPADSPGAHTASIPSMTPADAFVAPLKFGSNSTVASEGYRGDIPTIIPGISGHSPQDTDNDRLREEIIRSLSRENSQEPESQPNPDGSIPQNYEKYWDSSTGPGPHEVSRPLVSETHPEWTNTHPLAAQDPYASAQTPVETVPLPVAEPKRPRLGRRFSWESSSSAEEPMAPVSAAEAVVPPMTTATATEKPEAFADYPEPMVESLSKEQSAHAGEISDDAQRIEKPRLSIVPPVPQTISPPEEIVGPRDGHLPEKEVTLPVGVSKVDEKQLQGFRDILNKTSAVDRIRAFDQTRDQFATLDTGLRAWLEFTVHAHPEHADLVRSSQTLSSGFPRTSPTTRKFPKLTSLGSLASKEDGAPAGAGHARRPSGHIGTIVTRQNVEQRGKDLLHTAGTFSGKAGEAAKGLFAKGRSKFRPSGDKVDQSTPASRRSLQLHFSPLSESGNSDSAKDKFSQRRSIVFGSLPIFKSNRNDNVSAVPATDPASSLEGSADDERSGKRFQSNGPGSYTRSTDNVSGDSSDQSAKKHSSPSDVDRRKEGGPAGRSEFAPDFEQEMNAALGLGPTEPHSPQASTSELRLSPSAAVTLPQHQPEGLPNEDTSICATCAPANEGPSENSLLDNASHSALFTASKLNEPLRLKIPASEARIPPIRRVSEDFEGSIPQKEPLSVDLPAQDLPVKGSLPEMPFEGVSSPKESPEEDAKENLEEDPPSFPPKELLPRDFPPESRFTSWQPSVSTLGIDEHKFSNPPEGWVDSPPSPLQQPVQLAGDDMSEAHAFHQPGSTAQISNITLPSLHDVAPGFGSAYPPRPPSSAEILESKRRSISGLPPSAPGVQSPLRNEVRYSPGTRSSMLSFGSFGRQSNKGTRPNTPAIETSERAASGDTKMDKLKKFGRRRRASVGNALSGLGEGFSKEIQGLQGRGSQIESHQKESGQKKRAFSRISGFFGRQQDPQSAQSKNSDFGFTRPSPAKTMPPAPVSSQVHDWLANNNHATSDPIDNDLPPPPVSRSSFSSVEQSPSARDARHRQSMPLPPIVATSSMLSGRFYSSMQSGEPSEPTHHTRTKSQPMLSPPPLSPIGGTGSSKSGQSVPLSDVSQIEERSSPEERDRQGVQPPVPPKSPETQPQPDSSPNLSNEIPNVPNKSTHPHHGDARLVNENPEPVELATHDDSSEEIIMSPTSYPGQEWTPMNYY